MDLVEAVTVFIAGLFAWAVVHGLMLMAPLWEAGVAHPSAEFRPVWFCAGVLSHERLSAD
jgi:hypothetical protein